MNARNKYLNIVIIFIDPCFSAYTSELRAKDVDKHCGIRQHFANFNTILHLHISHLNRIKQFDNINVRMWKGSATKIFSVCVCTSGTHVSSGPEHTNTGFSVWCYVFTQLFCSNCKREWLLAQRFPLHTLCQYLLMCAWIARWLGNVPLVWLSGTYKIILPREQTTPSPIRGGRRPSTLAGKLVVIAFPPAVTHWWENVCVLWQNAETTVWQGRATGHN